MIARGSLQVLDRVPLQLGSYFDDDIVGRLIPIAMRSSSEKRY